jgi:ParB-like chromosome segregation protein Spo0J
LLLAETSATPRYQIIEGERRWRAAHLAGLLEVPAYVKRDLSDEQISMAQVIANANRTDLTDFELAIAIQTLLDTQRIKKKEVAVLINKSLSTVSRLLGMLNPEVRPYVEEGLIRHAEVSAIFRSLPEDLRITLLEQVRAAGSEITTTMVRDIQAQLQDIPPHGQDKPSSVEEPSITSIIDPSLSEEETADPHNHQDSSFEPLNSVHGPEDAGSNTNDSTDTGRQIAPVGDKFNRRREIIDIKLTFQDPESLANFLNSSSRRQEATSQPTVVIRFSQHLAVALIEAMGEPVPKSPSEYASTILKLIQQNKS